MRVLYVLRYWPTRSETFVAAEIAELRRRGHEVVVVAIGRREDGEGLDPVPGLDVWEPPRGLGRARAWNAERRIRASHPGVSWLDRHQRPKDVSRACWVAERASGFDRVHAHFAGEAAEWARLVAQVQDIPFSVTVHASDLFLPRPSIAEVLADARPAVTVCEHHREWIERQYGVRAAVVRCGVDPGRFPPADPGRTGHRAGDDGPLRVVAVARWVPKKGLDTLQEAARQVRTSIALELLTDEPPSAVPGRLAAADVFVLPCRVAPDGDRDGVPVALMEAMAAGLPVVSTPVSGIPELVDEQVGWLVEPDAPAALAALLEGIGRNPAERARRGQAGRDRVSAQWTLDGQVDGLLCAWGAA